MVEIVAIEYGDRLLEQGVRKYPTSLKLVENACATRDLWALTETRSQSTAFPRYKHHRATEDRIGLLYYAASASLFQM